MTRDWFATRSSLIQEAGACLSCQFHHWDCTQALIFFLNIFRSSKCFLFFQRSYEVESTLHIKSYVARESSISKANVLLVKLIIFCYSVSSWSFDSCLLAYYLSLWSLSETPSYFSFVPVRWSILMNYLRLTMLALMLMITIKFTTQGAAL